MPPLYPPLGERLGIGSRVNRTLHGRSKYRPADVPGHNVFNFYTRPGIGDGVDLFAPTGTPVYAMEDCTQVRHANDTSKLEVVYLQGAEFLVVMAHIDAAKAGTGHRYKRGEVVGRMRGDLKDPHVHLEIARGQRGREDPITARTAGEFAAQLRELIWPENEAAITVHLKGRDVAVGGRLIENRSWVPLTPTLTGLGIAYGPVAYTETTATVDGYGFNSRLIDGRIWVAAADLAKAYGLGIVWTPKTKELTLEAKG